MTMTDLVQFGVKGSALVYVSDLPGGIRGDAFYRLDLLTEDEWDLMSDRDVELCQALIELANKGLSGRRARVCESGVNKFINDRQETTP